MPTHVSRDYVSANTGNAASLAFTSYLYTTAIFLNKILGYSIVGQTGFNINNTNSNTFTFAASSAIAAGSNGATLPQSTINVGSTTGFPASGTIYVSTSAGVQIVRYSGTTATTFNNCTGGTGTMTAGQATTIAAGSNGSALPQATINVASTTGFATSGTIYVITTVGPQIVTYTGTTATSFTGCSGGTGTMATGNAVTSAGGAVTCGLNRILAATGAPITITTTFPHGMSTGEFANIIGTGALSTGTPFTPYPVQVVSPTQLILTNTTAGVTYVANSQTLQAPGMLIASGTGASINFAGAPATTAIQVPTTSRTVVNGTAPTTGDVGRLLVIKSNLYPTKNSGCFKITAVNTATNSYTVDYRSSDTPPPESGMSWWLYEIENQVSNYLAIQDYNRGTYGVTAASNTSPIQLTFNGNVISNFITGQRVTVAGVTGNTAANGTWTITMNGANTMLLTGSAGNGTYAGGGTVTRIGYLSGPLTNNSKLILQSPHSSGWQVRLATEITNLPLLVTPYCSVSVGYDGSVTGDWSVGGTHTHTLQFINNQALTGEATTQYSYTLTGSAHSVSASRLTMVGDDLGQSFFLYARALSAGSNGLLMFGLPDNEPTPLPPSINRPFVYGGCSGAAPDFGGINMRWAPGFNIGFTYRDTNPEMCGIAGWVNADGASGTSTVYSANAGDCPFTGTTEVLPWEIWGGIATDPSLNLPYPTTGLTVYSLNQRFMGTAPFIRQGRTNFGAFTLSTDNTTAITVIGATNATPIQITSSAPNSLTTGQTVVISGVNGNTAANGTFVVTVVDSTHFNLNGSVGNGTYTSGGTANGTPRWIHLQNGIYVAWNGAGGLTP